MDEEDSIKRTHDKRAKERADADNAANLIRRKLDELYEHEPNASAESEEARHSGHSHSKHQRFMYELTSSGKTLAEIQTAWHDYYASLNDKEKHEVWDEFYAANGGNRFIASTLAESKSEPNPKDEPPKAKPRHKYNPTHINHSANTIAYSKQNIMGKTKHKKSLSAKQHFQSLAFGLGLGVFVVFIFLFGFFNERFIAPFVTPSKHVSSTPIIAGPGATASANPEVIIPKINVEIPVVYDVNSIDDAAIQKGLERGAVHYATTPSPGQTGNVVIFGHSSNNIFNPGNYKFAFTLLGWLNEGDTFYLTKDKKVYVYKVYKKAIVEPNDVSVLNTADKPDTATLITCDPPGTSVHRLIIKAEQISPSPAANVASTAPKPNAEAAIIPSDAPSLWQRVKGWFE